MALVVHAVIAVALIVAYVALRISGDDANLIGGILIGYLGGVTSQVGLRKAGAAPPP